jgi:uncharacterized protein YcfJ|tara:strand:+ start:55 stop:552 length:498 start_codon:yes stop_codon:yes gene_type:complete
MTLYEQEIELNLGDNMNKKLSAILITSIISTVSLAQNPYPVDNAIVFDHYKNAVKQVPYEVEVCNQVRQGTGDGSATNEIIGGIIGGAIGNKFGEGDGKDAMTLAGIFLGASLAHDDQLAQGPGVLVTKCYYETRYEESVYSKVYSHSTLTFRIKGKKYRVDFVK